jgi:hypothetical protein
VASIETDLAAWLDRSRLNLACAVRDHLSEPRMKSALDRLFANTEQAITNLTAFLAQGRQPSAASRDR